MFYICLKDCLKDKDVLKCWTFSEDGSSVFHPASNHYYLVKSVSTVLLLL